jgi:hypothetical protein
MAASVSKIDVWTGEMEDRPGTLDAKLQPLAAAGADLTFILARPQPDRPGRSVLFLGPIKGAKQTKAAEAAGLVPAPTLAALHFEGPNKPGSASQVTHALAKAGINLRGLMAATIGTKFMLLIAFNSGLDAEEALKVIKASGKKAKAKK